MKLKIEIKNRWTGKVIFEFETEGNTIAKTINEYVRLANEGCTRANLTRADLTDANLTRADLTRADLTDANLTRANLTDANLTDANLTRADLTDANLTRADLTDANLTDANLTRANLTDANLTDANLTRADLTDANLTYLLETGKLDPIKFDFFGRMLVLKKEVPFLKKAIIDGKIDGTSYEGACACFMGTAAHAKECRYTEIPGIKPDCNSQTERWFMGIKRGDTPETSQMAKITIRWIEEFEILIAI